MAEETKAPTAHAGSSGGESRPERSGGDRPERSGPRGPRPGPVTAGVAWEIMNVAEALAIALLGHLHSPLSVSIDFALMLICFV